MLGFDGSFQAYHIKSGYSFPSLTGLVGLVMHTAKAIGTSLLMFS